MHICNVVYLHLCYIYLLYKNDIITFVNPYKGYSPYSQLSYCIVIYATNSMGVAFVFMPIGYRYKE